MSRVVVLSQSLLKSKVWLELPDTAKTVYLLFRCKCQMAKIRTKSGGKKCWTIENNGAIQFTYKEAAKVYGLTAPRFRRAVDALIERGFIDVAASGAGYRRLATLYAISKKTIRCGGNESRKKKPK